MSRIDLIPADTTQTGVRPSSVKSALMSKAVTQRPVFMLKPVITKVIAKNRWGVGRCLQGASEYLK